MFDPETDDPEERELQPIWSDDIDYGSECSDDGCGIHCCCEHCEEKENCLLNQLLAIYQKLEVD